MGDRNSYGSMGVHLGSDTHVTCHTYPRERPILAVDAGGWSLMLSAARRDDGIGEVDVVNARRLAQAVAIYLAELERLHKQQSEHAERADPVERPETAA